MKLSILFSSFAVLALAGLLSVGCSGQEASTPETTDSAPEAATMPPGHPPVDTPASTSMVPPPVIDQATLLTWDRPADWIDEPPANPMRQAQYRIPGEAGEAQCVAYYFGAGQGGGPTANAERWADQFTQPDGRPSRELLETESIKVGELDALLVQITGTYNDSGMMMSGAPPKTMPGYMLLGAVIEGPDSNWFFKLTGPEQTVRDNEDLFRGLVSSVRKPS